MSSTVLSSRALSHRIAIAVCMPLVASLLFSLSPSVANVEILEPGLLEAAIELEQSGVEVPVIVQFRQADLPSKNRRDEVAAAGARFKRAWENFEGVAAEASSRALQKLASNPWIARVSFDREVRGSLANTAIATGISQVWTGVSGGAGMTGAGVTVAVLDSGMTNSWVDDLYGKAGFSKVFVPGLTSTSASLPIDNAPPDPQCRTMTLRPDGCVPLSSASAECRNTADNRSTPGNVPPQL